MTDLEHPKLLLRHRMPPLVEKITHDAGPRVNGHRLVRSRRCASCDAWLNQYNPGPLCHPCGGGPRIRDDEEVTA